MPGWDHARGKSSQPSDYQRFLAALRDRAPCYWVTSCVLSPHEHWLPQHRPRIYTLAVHKTFAAGPCPAPMPQGSGCWDQILNEALPPNREARATVQQRLNILVHTQMALASESWVEPIIISADRDPPRGISNGFGRAQVSQLRRVLPQGRSLLHPSNIQRVAVVGSHYSAPWRASALLVPAPAPVGAPRPAGLSARDRGDPRQEGHRTGRNLLKSVRQELLQACGNSMAVTVVAAALTQVLSHLCARAHAFGPLWSPPVLLLGARRT